MEKPDKCEYKGWFTLNRAGRESRPTPPSVVRDVILIRPSQYEYRRGTCSDTNLVLLR